VACLRLILAALVVSLYGCSDGGSSTQPPPPDPLQDASDELGQGGSGGAVEAGKDVEEEAWAPGPLRVVTWNVHDFYDDVAGNCQCTLNTEDFMSPSALSTKVSSVSQTLAGLAGDVVMLQEVENIGVLDKLASSSALASLQYQYKAIFAGNDPRGINIGFLSRYPIQGAYSHKDDKFTREDSPGQVYVYARDALEVHLDYRGKHLAFIGVHFKAKTDGDDPDRRLAEAQHSRKIADAILQNASGSYVWVLGDFNDTPGSAPFLAVQNGLAGPLFDDAGGYVGTADRYTYTYGGQKQLIDHVFASPTPAGRIDKSSIKIVHGQLPSDHAPVAATYQVP
jgi:endonuclease/exonuclease/phosphatase family metal-dependent hydrolase